MFSVAQTPSMSTCHPACEAQTTDTWATRHIAALYMTYLTSGGDASTFENVYNPEEMTAALHKAVATVIRLQNQILGTAKRANSLNICVTDGIHLIAYRFRNHKTSQPPSLYWSTRAGVTLNRKYPDNPDGIAGPQRYTGIPEERHGTHLIVASEPSTYQESDWDLIGRNQFLVSGAGGTFEVGDCPYGTDWDGSD
jgi:glutamine amidotransferase